MLTDTAEVVKRHHAEHTKSVGDVVRLQPNVSFLLPGIAFVLKKKIINVVLICDYYLAEHIVYTSNTFVCHRSYFPQ